MEILLLFALVRGGRAVFRGKLMNAGPGEVKKGKAICAFHLRVQIKNDVCKSLWWSIRAGRKRLPAFIWANLWIFWGGIFKSIVRYKKILTSKCHNSKPARNEFRGFFAKSSISKAFLHFPIFWAYKAISLNASTFRHVSIVLNEIWLYVTIHVELAAFSRICIYWQYFRIKKNPYHKQTF